MTDEELIRQVALEVMGWHLSSDLWVNSKGERQAQAIWKPEDYCDCGTFNPLTNANHWMQVVERMRELGYWIKISNNIYRHPDIWKVWVNKETPETFQDWTATNATIGHAVCEAALKAMKEEKLPKLTDLRGIAPNLTEGLSSEDFVRKGRDEDG